MNDVNEIFEQAKRDGYVNIYLDTPPEIMNLVKDYNEDMGVCRVNRKRMKNYEALFMAVNPILSLIFYYIAMMNAKNMILFSVMIVVFLALYFIFAMVKKNLLVVTIASAVMMVMDLRMGLLLIINLALWIQHMTLLSELKTHEGYSAFTDIRIINTGEVSSKGKEK